jgi:hypothetical protein
MRRMLAVLTIGLVSGSSAAAQSSAPPAQSKCPAARMTLIGALIGFGAGTLIASPIGAPLGGNVFEDTSDGEQKMWLAVGGLTVAGAVVGNVLAQHRCGARRPRPSHPAPVVLTHQEVRELARTINAQRPAQAPGEQSERPRARAPLCRRC